MDIKTLIGEATEYDKKEALEERKPKSWLKSVSAFANGIGGWLLFGVANDDTVVGLSDAKYVSEKISEAIKDKMDPLPKFVLSIHEIDGKQIVRKRRIIISATAIESHSFGLAMKAFLPILQI